MKTERLARSLIGLAFAAAGANHFFNPAFYERMMPEYLPAPAGLVALSGIAECGLGLLALSSRHQKVAGWGLLALLVAVFPANLHMALHPDRFPAVPEPFLWLRLPFQPLLMAAVWWTLLKKR